MKLHITKKILSFIFLVVAAFTVNAQGLRSAYFLEGATFRHQLNPAFIGERNYVSIPALGNINVSGQGNVGLSDFIYKYNDPKGKYDLTTFMNKSVGRDEFLGSLHDMNKVAVNVNLTILSFGFHSWGGFNTFELGVRSNTNLNLPYGLFNFMKTGMSAEGMNHYNFKKLRLKSNNYVDMSFGHAREINEYLTVGGKFKLLFGGANLDAKFDEMDIRLSGEEWIIKSRGSLDGSIKGGYFELDDPNAEGLREITGFDVSSGGVGGFGVGIDMGATYKMDQLVEGLTLSAALLDLGFISWGNNLKGRSAGEFYFDGFKEFAFESGEDANGNKKQTLENQFDDLMDDLEGMIKYYDDGKKGGRVTGLATTLNIGAEYILPYYKKLSFGFLSSTRINRPNTWTEGRLYANISPIKWFDASVNVAASTYGASFGWVINFHPKGFNFFIGSDHMAFKVNPQFIPINSFNTNVNLGFNITFGDGRKNNSSIN